MRKRNWTAAAAAVAAVLLAATYAPAAELSDYTIKQLLERGLIIEVDGEGSEASPGKGNPKRPYRLTALGKSRTSEEAQRLRELVKWAEDALILEGGTP